jgi:hypothetical protein
MFAWHPMQVNSQTKGRQHQVEHSLAKKKAVRVKTQKSHFVKKVTKKVLTKKARLLEAKRKLVHEIIQDHKVAIANESKRNHIAPALVVGIIATESSNNPKAVSNKKAKGLMQTRNVVDKATGVSCDSMKSECSIKKGTAYWNHLAVQYKIHPMSERLVAYNRGQEGFRKFIEELNGNPEKDSFVVTVKEYMQLAQDELRDQPL